MARFFSASLCAGLAIACIAASIAPRVAHAAPGDLLYIEVSATKLRADPKHWASPVSDLEYGDKVVEISSSSGWYRVRGAKGEGYVHESAITQRKVKLRSRGIDPDIRADESDIVLAGKGFNKDVEASYAQTETSLNYESVNRVESSKVSEQELLAFLRDGRLNVD